MKFSWSIVHPIVQTIIHPNIQTDHPDSMAETNKPDPNSPLFTLASVSSKLLKDASHETVLTPAQGMSPEGKIPSVDLETPSMKLSLPTDSKHPTGPSTPHQLTANQLT